MRQFVIVCGGRDFTDFGAVAFGIREVLAAEKIGVDNCVITSGGQRGADTLALEWAVKNEFAALRVPAQWKRFKAAAGTLRNQAMLDMVTVFATDPILLAMPGGVGTADMVERYVGYANTRGRLRLYDFRNEARDVSRNM